MELEPHVITELRTLFKLGATPSRLMRYIIEQVGQQPLNEIDRLIRAYLREAFGVPMFRASAGLLAEGQDGLQIAHVNRNVIHLMIANRSQWDKEAMANGDDSPSWIDSLVATDEAQAIEKCQPELSNELKDDWDKLNDQAKKFIKRLIGNSLTHYEKIEILETLVERLQQQVRALEHEVGSPVDVPTK